MSPSNPNQVLKGEFHNINQDFIERVWKIKLLKYEKHNEKCEGILIETNGGK